MFRNTVNSTEFTTQEANMCMGSKIPHFTYANDASLVSTLRATLPRRMKDEDSLYINMVQTMSVRSAQTMSEFARSKLMCTNQLFIISLYSASDHDEVMREAMEMLSGTECVYMEPATRFFKNAFGVWIAVNETSKSTIIFVDNLDIRRFHYLQCSSLTWFPWYFNPKKGDKLSDDESVLLSSLCEKNPDNYIAIINKMASAYDFMTEKVGRVVHSIFTDSKQSAITNLENDIKRYRNNIDELFSQISTCQKRISQSMVTLCGLQRGDSDEESENILTEYLNVKKDIYVKDYCDDRLYIQIKGPMQIYSPDAAEKNMYNIAGSQRTGDITSTEMCVLLRALFIKRILYIDFCAEYYIDFHSCYVDGVKSATFDQFRFKNHMPNPHIYYHACMGGYKNDVTQCLIDRDYIGALESLIASCSSLNWTDYTVTSEFVKDLYRRNNKWIRNGEGNYMNASEAIKWLKESGEWDAIYEEVMSNV